MPVTSSPLPMAAAPLRVTRTLLLQVAVVGALVALPLVTGGYLLTLTTEAMIFAVFALSVNLLLGHTGLISLGQSAYFGAGAYGFAISVLVLGLPAWAAVLVGLLSSVVLAAVLSVFCLRTDGVRFLLITLAFGELLRAVIVRIPRAGGDDGLVSLPRFDLSPLGLDSWDPATFYVLTVLVLAVVAGLLLYFLRTPFGSVLAAIRENQTRAIAVGYRVIVYKRAAFVLAGLVGGIAGVLQAQNLSFVSPEFLSWKFSAEAILMVIIGGRKSFIGPVLGTFAFLLVREGLSLVTQDYLLFFGLFFMLVVALFPDGLIGLLSWKRVRRAA